MHPPDEVLWGDAPGPGPALRSEIERATQEASDAAPSVASFALCLIGLAVFLAVGVLRLLVFGPWWPAARRPAEPSRVSAVHPDGGLSQRVSAQRKQTSPHQAKPQPTQTAR